MLRDCPSVPVNVPEFRCGARTSKYSKTCARPHERKNGAKRYVSREERVAEHRSEAEERNGQRLLYAVERGEHTKEARSHGGRRALPIEFGKA